MSTPARSKGVSATVLSRTRLRLRKVAAVCAVAYLVGLVVWGLSLYLVGERWWVTAAALYLPRVVLAGPLPFIAAALWLIGPRRLLWSQAAAAALVVVPLMGFVVPWPNLGQPDPRLRVLTFNVNSAYSGVPEIIAQIIAQSPDLVLLEEAPWAGQLSEQLKTRYPFVLSSTQFIIASRFPIESMTEPDKLPFFGRERSPRFIRYTVKTPLGSIAVYCVHPISPRGVLHLHRFRGALRQLLSGELLAGDPEEDVQSNATLRELQIETMADEAALEKIPVLIAGDTNLPGLSAAFRSWLSEYSDGFRAVGWGFGYTFPSKHPFLRLDRILVSDELRFTSFQVACPGVSDHLCVVADVGARK